MAISKFEKIRESKKADLTRVILMEYLPVAACHEPRLEPHQALGKCFGLSVNFLF